MRTAQVVDLERYDFAGGGYALVWRLGRHYTYAEIGRNADWLEPPIVKTGLARKTAYAYLDRAICRDLLRRST